MAFLYEESFLPSPEIAQNQPYLADDLNTPLKTVKAALTKISGPPTETSEGPLYQIVPKGLNAHRDGLKPNFHTIWSDTIISYDADAYGACAKLKDYEIIFGYFFTKPQSVIVIEKVLMHEFLHLVVDLPKAMHHGRINHIIQHGLRLPGDPNPLGTVGLEC
jgi:hypothetical protein